MTSPTPSNTELDAFMIDFMSRQKELIAGYDPFIINIARGYLDEKTPFDKSKDRQRYDKETVKLSNRIKKYLNNHPDKIEMYEFDYTPPGTKESKTMVIVAMSGQMPNLGIKTNSVVKAETPD